jgi:D-lactate dehydrogenase
VFARLLTFSNVIITAHQAFFTLNALTTIAQTTMANISGFSQGAINPQNEVTAERVK